MVFWDDRRNVETDCLNCFCDVGENCVLDLSVPGKYPRVRPPGCGLETFARMPPILYCRVVEVLSDTVVQSCSCARLRGKWTFPGRNTGCVGSGCFPEMKSAVDSAYIKPDSVVESPVYVWSVTGSLLFGSPLRCVRGLQQLPLLDSGTTVVSCGGVSCRNRFACGEPGATTTASTPLPGTFLGLTLDLRSDKLYDLVDDIPDVMGLRALRPSAAMVKVMSVPDSHCIRVVTPDDHVNIGFHEILIHELADEELPFVILSELGCLHLDWPNTLSTFMSRYQFDLDQMRKACWDRYGSTQSGTCTTCGKHIQQNLGRHIALCHMELAQLWRCPVSWCTVWKGTAQDCVDHMRRAHDIPPLVKVANLASWFPPWTVTREQWYSMSRPAISGIAVDTLLFSRIGVPLFHRYRVFDRPGTHGAFRGTYMRRIHTFLEELDAASLRRRHRRCAQDIAARMSRTSLRDAEDRTPDVSSHPKVSR